MLIDSHKALRVAYSLLASLALAGSVAAQTFPVKPVSMVVAFPPGGGSDMLGRAVGKGMAEVFGQPVIVENVVGVGGRTGCAQGCQRPARWLHAVGGLAVGTHLYALGCGRRQKQT